jgi:hypothetical protein
MGLLIKLQNGDTQLKSLKFGNDRPGGGDSGQPYIQSPIGDQNQPSALDTDFLLRGGINAPRNAATDVSRLSKYFTNLKSPKGLLFTAKQNILSLTAPKTEASGIVNGGIYTPLSTLAQAGVGFLGGHLNKQGLDPTGIISALSIKDYGPVVYQKNQDNENRLVELLNSTTITQYNPNPNIRSYPGGPGSTLGIGNTNIKFSTYEDGTPIRTFNKKNYLVGKPFDKIEPDKFQIPLGASNLFTSQSNQTFPTSPTLTSLGRTTYQYDSYNSVYKSGSLIAREDINSYLTSSYEVITRNSGSIKYVSPINNILRSSGIGTTPGVDGNGRQIIVDPEIFTTSGSTTFMATDPNGVFLDTYSSRNTLFNDNLNQKYDESPKSHKEGYLANLDKNAGYYYTEKGELSYTINQYPRGIAADFRATPRGIRGFNDAHDTLRYDKITTSSSYISSNAKIIDKIYYGSNSEKRISSPINSGDDIINFRISIVNPTSPSDETTLQFKAYIDSFSDSYNADWKEQNYMGRAESFFKYTAFSRDISLGFTIIAPSSNNLEIMYNQLNTLASSMAPTYTKSGYMAGNLHRITMGNYINQQYGVITGFTYEIMDESPWEINQDNQLPYYIKVTGLNFKVIHNFRPESQFTEPNRSLKFIDQ